MTDLIPYLTLALVVGFALLDLVARARVFPTVPRWKLKGVAFFLLYLAISTSLPLLWDGWLGEHRLFAADTLSLWVQIGGGLLALELGIYLWHRTMHTVQPLWRWFHQMHHSAERIDVWGAFYFHPLDMIGWTVLTSLTLVVGFGVGAEAAVIINLVSIFLSLFSHANLCTPHWLGYLIVRPESHAAHHERGIHGRNYCELPVIDMVFGTFHNPREYPREVGFHDGASRQLGAMLIGREIA